MAQVAEHELPGGAVRERPRAARVRVDQLSVDEAARTEVHPVLFLALAPQRRPDVADPHGLGDAGAETALEHRAEGGLPTARLAGDEDALDARARQVEAPVGSRLDQVGGVGGRQDRGLRAEELDRGQQPLGVAGAEGNVTGTDAVEGSQGGARHERARVICRDEPLAGREARGGVAPRRPCHPVLEVVRGQRDVARRAGRAARRVDPDDLLGRRAEMRSERILGRDRLPQLPLLGQRQAGEVGEPAGVRGRGAARGDELGPVERRAREDVCELCAVRGVVDRELFLPRQRLDLGGEHQFPASRGS
jgi:hypothetical protein